MGNVEEDDSVTENGNSKSLKEVNSNDHCPGNDTTGSPDDGNETVGIIGEGEGKRMPGISKTGDDDVLLLMREGEKISRRRKKVHFEDEELTEHPGTEEDGVVYLRSFNSEEKQTHRSDKKERSKEIARKEKMDEKRRIYSEEKAQLAKKLDDIKASFDEEVKKYERDLQEKRQDYLTQLDDLQMADQVSSIGKRMEDLEQLEKGLNSRLEHFLEYEKEIQEFEHYLNRRQELCQTQERDLQKRKEELDTFHEELEADRFNLENKGFDTSRIGSKKSSSSRGQDTTEEEDYILKANLRKCQLQLAHSEDQNTRDARETASLTRELEQERETSKKQTQKIKHLESQLSIYISMKRPAGSDHQSLRSFGSKVSQDGSGGGRSAASNAGRSNTSVERLKSGQLSINQEAQMRHKLRQQSREDQRGSKYLPRRNSSDSGRGSSQATVDNGDQAGKETKSRLCSIL